MLLKRTERAQQELRPGVRTLGQRQRTFLLLADGKKSLLDFYAMFDGKGKDIVLALVRDGYLEAGATSQTVQARATLPATPVASVSPPADAAPPAASSAVGDSFEGKRSLATTRMFLFDLCERMFVRRDPVLAGQFREALRGAKDRVSMLSAAREMVAEIERVAGHERADSISERIAMLLPPE